MNVKKAHEHLKDAENSIRHFFFVTNNLDVICHLLKLARKAEPLGMAIAYARVALREMTWSFPSLRGMTYGGGGDERCVIVKHIEKALGEMEYQRRSYGPNCVKRDEN